MAGSAGAHGKMHRVAHGASRFPGIVDYPVPIDKGPGRPQCLTFRPGRRDEQAIAAAKLLHTVEAGLAAPPFGIGDVPRKSAAIDGEAASKIRQQCQIRRDQKHTADPGNTFEAVAKEWLIKCERDGLAKVTIEKIAWLLAKAYPVIGSIPIAQITPHEALAVLRKVEATGAYESARRMRSVLSRVFRYGVATVRCDKDVAADLRGAIAAPKVKHFAAITRPSEVGALLRAIGTDKMPTFVRIQGEKCTQTRPPYGILVTQEVGHQGRSRPR